MFINVDNEPSFKIEDVKALLEPFIRSEYAFASPRIIRKDGLNHYAGSVVQKSGRFTYLSKFLPFKDSTYLGRPERPLNYLSVSPDFHIMKVDVARKFGGYDESYETLEYALGSICLKARKDGFLSSYNPFALVVNSANQSLIPQYFYKINYSDIQKFVEEYGEVFKDGDPCHNPNFNDKNPYYKLDSE